MYRALLRVLEGLESFGAFSQAQPKPNYFFKQLPFKPVVFQWSQKNLQSGWTYTRVRV
jgi:hypothetical protein